MPSIVCKTSIDGPIISNKMGLLLVIGPITSILHCTNRAWQSYCRIKTLWRKVMAWGHFCAMKATRAQLTNALLGLSLSSFNKICAEHILCWRWFTTQQFKPWRPELVGCDDNVGRMLQRTSIYTWWSTVSMCCSKKCPTCLWWLW